LTEVLVLLERFDARHGLALDLPGRVMLLGEVMTDYTERVGETVAPVH
jgi:hypothetical protein